MKKRLYVAYGSNLNVVQMKYRCPDAKLYRTGTLTGYELQFKGQPHGAFATITPRAGGSVPVALWEISKRDELALDRYEGYPSHYFKRDVTVQTGGEEVTAMVYIMNQRMGFGLPSPHYYDVVRQGYQDCGLDAEALEDALLQSTAQFYTGGRRQQLQQSLLDSEVEEEEAMEELDGLDGPEELDEPEPISFLEGMGL